MKRIMVIGCCGSGKSTLSRKLQEITELPLFHLDQYYWKPHWTETPKEEWEPIVHGLAQKEDWIIDGNYGGTMQSRFERADTIIYMDYSTIRCLWRVLKRIWKYNGHVRPDMPEGCNERFDFEFIHYVATYNLVRKKNVLKQLKIFEKSKNIVRIKNDKQNKLYLENLTKVKRSK